jgi:hypothetical protein
MKYRERYVGKLWQRGKWQVLLWLRWPPKIKKFHWPCRGLSENVVVKPIFEYWLIGPIEVRHFLV